MKIVIGKYVISLNEDVIKATGEETYVKRMLKSLRWTGIDPGILEERLRECHELVTGAVE